MTSHAIYIPKPLDPTLVDNYLKMIAQALGSLSRNYGALRKDIWNYMVEHFDRREYY